MTLSEVKYACSRRFERKNKGHIEVSFALSGIYKKIFSGECLRDLHPSFNRVEDIHITKWKIAHLFYVRFQ